MKRLLMTCAVAVTMFILTGQANGNTLITDSGNNRVIEVDSSGTIVWVKTGLYHPIDAERLANGNTLIADMDNQRVIEVNSDGTIVWKKTGLKSPVDAERLANGNTLIAEWAIGLIEVDESGATVWEITGLAATQGVERLANGNTLIAGLLYGVIEINSLGTIIWEKTGLAGPVDAKRLANGNTLIVDTWDDRVIEVDVSKSVVWEKTDLDSPYDAERLANGNTLIADMGNNRVIEVNSDGTIVWEKTGLFAPFDAERIGSEEPPEPPWRFVHITDPHIGGDDKEEMYKVYETLAAVIQRIVEENPKPDFILATGDISDEGCNAECRLQYLLYLSAILHAKDYEIPVYTVPGNHDHRPIGDCDLSCYNATIRALLPSDVQDLHRLLPDDYRFEHKGFVFIGLDSGHDWPRSDTGLTQDQISALRLFGSNHPSPKIIFMHHPGKDIGVSWLDQVDIQEETQQDFLDWCQSDNVQLVLAGHSHQDHIYDKDGYIVPSESTEYPLFVQTPSITTKDWPIIQDEPGYRLIEVKNGKGYAKDYTPIGSMNLVAVSNYAGGGGGGGGAQALVLSENDTQTPPLPVANLHVYDTDGHHVGTVAGGEPEWQIPKSYYFLPYIAQTPDGDEEYPEKIIIFNPTDEYIYEMIGTDFGDYKLVIRMVINEKKEAFIANSILISIGARHIYTVNWDALSAGEEGVMLKIDADGDGIFERTVIADKDLTAAEFALQTETVIDFEPDTLNLRSPGKFVTVYIELPEDFDVSNLNVSTLRLNDTVFALSAPVTVGDYDEDGIADLMVKFARQQVIEVLGSGTQMVILTGRLSDGRPIAGIDFIRVIDGTEAKAVAPEFESTVPEGFIADMEENLQKTTDDSVDIGGKDAFGVKEAVGFMLFEADGIIGELGPESFNYEESAFELACALDDVFTMLDEGMYFEVMVILNSDILERMDGCANIGQPDEDDWVTSIEGQVLLYPLVVETIELLESLL